MTIAHTGLDVRRIGGRIGAEIDGVDLTAPLDKGTVAELSAALLAHKVLVFRGQSSGRHLDDAGQTRFAAAFGPLTTAHPVVRVHPESGERGLFIGGFAQRLLGLSATEPRDILRLLQAYVTRPENTVRIRWNPGDLVLFDNRITQHYAPDDYGDLPRRLHRVTVAGDAPVGVDGRQSYVIEGDDASHYTPKAA